MQERSIDQNFQWEYVGKIPLRHDDGNDDADEKEDDDDNSGEDDEGDDYGDDEGGIDRDCKVLR